MKINLTLAGPPKPLKKKQRKKIRKAFEKQLIKVRTEINKLEELRSPEDVDYKEELDAFMKSWDNLSQYLEN